MPRIDPVQLLNCLGELLSPIGGVKSRDEVERLARLMTKFSKKLVSKCIYIQILKFTETDLLSLFMASGGWRLMHTWLTEAITANNWPLVRELLELLLLCPVGIERLKTNNCPKLVKELSKDEIHLEIRALASKLVEQWLKTVKGEEVIPVQVTDIPQIISEAETEGNTESNLSNGPQCETVSVDNNVDKIETVNLDTSPESDTDNVNNIPETKIRGDDEDTEKETLPVLKITLKNGKQLLSQVEDEDNKSSDDSSDKEKNREKHRSRSKDKSRDRSSSRSSSKHSSKSSSSDKHKSSLKSSSSSSKHKSKDRSREKDKHSSSSHSSRSKDGTSSDKKSSSSSSKSKDRYDRQDKEKSKEKDKDHKTKDGTSKSSEKSDEKSQSPSIHKLGKIPKLSDVKREKPSISIEIRKPDEPKPKTVKTFNSKFRKHGLEEEVKPPPSRASLLNKKPPPVLPPTVSIPKRPSPVHNEIPPEKKIKTIDIEKPGAIKLIPPKPKPMMLQESDMFMDALNASATNKKEPKKRKRRTSGSKDGNAPNEGSPPHTPTPSSPNSDNKSVPPRFYQDTLETEENKEKVVEKSSEVLENANKEEIGDKSPEEKMDTTEPHTLTVNGLKGVLCYHKRKGPKKSIKWKPDSELEEIQYFELDETERVNVTKTFTDMKHLERIHEREAFEKARNLINDDIMEEKTNWRPLILIDADGQIQVEHGKNSKEKDIQAVRQKGTLQPLYFHKAMIPDSPFEPDPETHIYSEPCIIPLDDITGNQDNVSDFRNMPWPEPKGNVPAASSTNINVQPIFPTNLPQFPNNFPAPQFSGVPPGFQGPPMVAGDWPNGVPPHMMPNGIPAQMAAANMPPGAIPPGAMPPGAMPPGAMPPGNMPPGMMVSPDNMMMGPEMFGAPNPMFPVPPEGFNMQQNMFPMDYNMPGPHGPPGPDGFAGPGSFRGAMRGRGAGGHWRGKATGTWEGPQRGRGGTFPRGGRKAVCIYFQRKGSCRQGDNCSFLHPGVNCPF
ncbi:serine/threonine-protein phosphatase 1 regulatory subunit 10 [Epargyreus clarus]|uniref:serine/threonine-protein phosphatase 1 regulatory subunit 10 n=1 Tax=Epargyreus clarus TaxID=520877 RepID=UPI003C2EAD93